METTKPKKSRRRPFHPLVGKIGMFNPTYEHSGLSRGSMIKVIGPGITSQTYRVVDENGRRTIVHHSDIQRD